MNIDTIEGQAKNVGGQVKEAVGNATGDTELQGSGIADQWAGLVQQAVGHARDFARERPLATAVLAVVVGVAFFNILRGKR